MKNILFALLVLAGTIYISGCDCEEQFTLNPTNVALPLRVENAFLNQSYEYTVLFDRPVDTSSFKLGNTFKVLDAFHWGGYRFSPDLKQLIIDYCEVCDTSGTSDSPYSFKIFLDGDNSDGSCIKAQDGSILDGNNDGQGGDSYTSGEISGNNCPEVGYFVVNTPADGSSASFTVNENRDSNGKLVIDVSFSSRVDIASVVPDSSIVLLNSQYNPIKGVITQTGTYKLRYTSNGLYDNIPSGSYYFYVWAEPDPYALKSLYGDFLYLGTCSIFVK